MEFAGVDKLHGGYADRVGPKPSARFSGFLANSSFSCTVGHWKFKYLICLYETHCQLGAWHRQVQNRLHSMNEKTCDFVALSKLEQSSLLKGRLGKRVKVGDEKFIPLFSP